MPLVIECIPAPDGVAVAPCGTLHDVALVPVVRSLAGGTLDYSGVGGLFAWTVSCVLIAFVVGLTVGAIMRVIRSA